MARRSFTRRHSFRSYNRWSMSKDSNSRRGGRMVRRKARRTNTGGKGLFGIRIF